MSKPLRISLIFLAVIVVGGGLFYLKFQRKINRMFSSQQIEEHKFKYTLKESYKRLDSMYVIYGKVYETIDSLTPKEIVKLGTDKSIYVNFIKSHPKVAVDVWSYQLLREMYEKEYLDTFTLDVLDPWNVAYRNRYLYWPLLDTSIQAYPSKEEQVHLIQLNAEMLPDFTRNPYMVVLYPFSEQNGYHTEERLSIDSKSTYDERSTRTINYSTNFTSEPFEGLWIVFDVQKMKIIWASPLSFANSESIESPVSSMENNPERAAQDMIKEDLKKRFGQSVFKLYQDSLHVSEEEIRLNDTDNGFFR